MVIISPIELRPEQKKYLDMAEKERIITDEDLKRGISTEELIRRVHKRIDAFPDKR
jgi:hypothetical protein